MTDPLLQVHDSILSIMLKQHLWSMSHERRQFLEFTVYNDNRLPTMIGKDIAPILKTLSWFTPRFG